MNTLFERLEMRDPEHIAVKHYHDYRAGSGKTLKSIQITLAAWLEKFNLESLAAMTVTDELDLAALGERKTARASQYCGNSTRESLHAPRKQRIGRINAGEAEETRWRAGSLTCS
jgi:type IV secretion system protein VirD4